MAKWKVVMADGVENEVTTLLETKVLTKADIKVLLQWIDEMEEFGPDHIAKSSEWHDHALERDWQGFRASAFSSSGRVIYKVVGNKIVVEVHRVTAKHDYRKK